MYKRQATNVGGVSASPAEVKLTTLDNLPVIANIGNLNARYLSLIHIFLVMQVQTGWGTSQWLAQKAIIDYMIANNKLDPFRVLGNGLSGGGAGTWGFFTTNPTYNAGIIPMSADAIQLSYPDTVNLAKYTPIWNIHGQLDNSPAPSTLSLIHI